ncbi:MAG: hypothetical protein K0U38_11765 [Epsilonproteobacteria bacterium]|nr:hypothetical protein [Campylobacterota bacterium]
MNRSIKALALGAILSLTLSTNLIAEETTVEKKITIEEMELQLAHLGAEIAQEKVKLYQKEALLFEMKLDLMRKKKEKEATVAAK